MFPNKDLTGQHPSPYDDRAPSTGSYPPSAPGYSSRPEYQEGFDPRMANTMAHMATLAPQSDMYRLPPHDVYHGAPPDGYRPHPPHVTFNQPAPRQRTAIACRYCRRRKIRCSGFESSEDGRCTNCQRFNQECIFTPVSSQAQAFVPAHTAYPHLRTAGLTGRGRPVYGQNPPVIYGAHGQPLNAAPSAAYSPDQGYPQSTPQAPYGLAPADSGVDMSGRKRGPEEGHGHSLPPPLSASTGPGRMAARRGSSADYQYLDPSGQLPPGSPASSTASYQTSYSQSQHPPHPHPPAPPPSSTYYPPDAGRPSSYDRGSSSPRDSISTASGGYGYHGLHPPQVLPAHLQGGGTPPPLGRGPPAPAPLTMTTGEGGRSGMSIQNLLDPGQAGGQPGRSATDHEMLDAFMPRRGK